MNKTQNDRFNIKLECTPSSPVTQTGYLLKSPSNPNINSKKMLVCFNIFSFILYKNVFTCIVIYPLYPFISLCLLYIRDWSYHLVLSFVCLSSHLRH